MFDDVYPAIGEGEVAIDLWPGMSQKERNLMTDIMNRWEILSLGLDKLALRPAPRPAPKTGEILVEVDAGSLNYRDGEVVDNGMGMNLTFPFTPTSDMAGRVVALGEGVTRFAVDDRVISTCITGRIDGTPLSWTDAPALGRSRGFFRNMLRSPLIGASGLPVR